MGIYVDIFCMYSNIFELVVAFLTKWNKKSDLQIEGFCIDDLVVPSGLYQKIDCSE